MRATSFDEVDSGALLEPEQRFEAAITMAQTGFRRMLDDGFISGAMIYGSAVSRDHHGKTDIDPLSDLDMLAVVPDNQPHRAERRLRQFGMAIRRETAVAPELGWMTEQDARHGHHNLLPTTLAWMKQQAARYPDMTVGEAPTAIIEPGDIDVLDAVSTWFRTARNNLLKASHSSDTQVTFGLSLPHLAARKSIDALRYCDSDDKLKVPRQLSLAYTKREVAAMASHVYGSQDRVLWDIYEEFGLIKQGFIGFLTSLAIDKIASRQGYEATLDDMAAYIVPKAADLLLRMHSQFDSMAGQLGDGKPASVAESRLLPEPPSLRYSTSHGQPVSDVGVYDYGLWTVTN